MKCVRRWIAVLLLVLAGGNACHGASSEDRRFQAAAQKMDLGLWDQAAADFGAFVTNFPESTRIPEAILYQAEAAITNRQYARGIQLLELNLERAGAWRDSYLLWIGQAQLQNESPSAAADNFARLAREFPNSPHALAANIGQAIALARMEQWPRVIELLTDPEGAFQKSSGALTNRAVAHGFLLLTEAEIEERDYTAAERALQALVLQTLTPELAWRRWHLQCRLDLAQDRAPDALVNSTNLLTLALASNNPRLVAESQVLRAIVFERVNALDDAVAVCANLITNAPPEHQRFALLKMAELRLAQNRPVDAIQTLEEFLGAHSNAPSADMALLTLGELRLKLHLLDTNRPAPGTNLLLQASNHFQTVLTVFTNSALAGKALLGKGWCLWTADQFAPAAEVFRQAVQTLPPSEDQAIARFKLGDSLFQLGNFSDALEQYASIQSEYEPFPAVREKLGELALYQTVRAALEATNLPVAEQALEQILEKYPNGFAGDRTLWLVGEGYSRQQNPADARRLFERFEELYPSSALLPEVRLAVARTYEIEGNWTNAISQYDSWVGGFTNHPSLPAAMFSMAWATFQARDEAQALSRFTNFVARWPTNELTSRAQWWIAEFHFRSGRWFEAEEYYQYIKPPDKLALEARMMAGRSAVARYAYNDAISYFSNLVANPASPTPLKVKAAFAAGDACVLRTPPGATNRVDDLREAIRWFERVGTLAPESPTVPAALARTGDCYKEMGEGSLIEAANSYRSAINHTNATVATRSQARVALGVVAEIRAEKAAGDERTALLKEALKHYSDVFVFDDSIEDGQQPDPFAVKEAGIKAARVAEQLRQWSSAEQIYRRLQRLFPAVAGAWDSRLENARRQQVRAMQ